LQAENGDGDAAAAGDDGDQAGSDGGSGGSSAADGNNDAMLDGDQEDGSDPPLLVGTKPLGITDLAALTRWLANELGVAEALVPDAVRVKSHQIPASRSDDSEGVEFLNSFIAADLTRVADALAAGRAGAALEEYLRADERLDIAGRIDVRERPQVLLDGVRPAAAPLGRWPATARHPLALSQQFAVNTILDRLGDPADRGLYSVNGPPGTGKTTMLRDLVAALVVARAERLARLSRPRDAFAAPVSWNSDGHTRSVHPPIPDMCGYEIVIASSNNGAVENVTAEIPTADAIDAPWRGTVEYLADPASLMLEGDAWGAVAARLGRRSHRGDFVNRFWWGTARTDPDAKGRPQRSGKGLHDLLRAQAAAHGVGAAGRSPADRPTPGAAPAGDGVPGPPLGDRTWNQAVRAFTTARDKVRRLTAERQRVADVLARQASVDAALTEAETAGRAARDQVVTAERALREAAEAHENAKRQAQRPAQDSAEARNRSERTESDSALARELCSAAVWDLRAHDAAAPGWWRRLLDRGAAGRHRGVRSTLASAVADREAAWQRAEEERRRAQAEVDDTLLAHREAQRVIEAAEQAATRKRKALERSRSAAERAERRTASRRAARDADRRTISRARRTWGDAVPGAEWQADPADPEAAERRELSAPWMDEELAAARSDVFVAALGLHQALLACEPHLIRRSLLGTMEVVAGGAPKELTEEQVTAAWQLLFLFVPVVSTTFASLDRLFAGLGSEALGWLFVDEAGQAAPQQVVGALWRTRRAIVVGDPLQLEPVITLPWTAQQRLRRRFGVAREWSPGGTSVQRVADRLARYGTALPTADGSPVWVGSPLRVHRRCDRLMFDVSNAIAYDGMMVFGTPEDRSPYSAVQRSVWLNVTGIDVRGKWVVEEGRVLERVLGLLSSRLRDAIAREVADAPPGVPPTWAEPADTPAAAMGKELHSRISREVFVVSPFRDVATESGAIARPFLSPRRVGTVHTTQGKESDVVILVLGTVPDQAGSRDWASGSPNLLNVAVSRARRRLIVIGDHASWRRHRYFATLAGQDELPVVDSTSWGVQSPTAGTGS
jgi:hypothetical protein